MKNSRKQKAESRTGHTSLAVINDVFCVLLAACCFVSCKTTTKVGTVEAGAAKEHTEFFRSMQQQAFQYHTFTARTQVELDIPGKGFSSRVDIRMVRDSAFQLSVQPFLGIEVFRMELNTDSVKVIDRMNKRYVAESYTALKGQTSLPITFNFYNLQALFSNRIFIPGERAVSDKQYSRFKLKQEGTVAEAQVKDAMDLLYVFIADGEEKLLSTHVTDKSGEYELQWLYKDFRLAEKQPFPMLMDVQVLDKGIKIGGMKLAFSQIKSDIPVKISNPIPDKYKRITFAEILKTLNSSSK